VDSAACGLYESVTCHTSHSLQGNQLGNQQAIPKIEDDGRFFDYDCYYVSLEMQAYKL